MGQLGTVLPGTVDAGGEEKKVGTPLKLNHISVLFFQHKCRRLGRTLMRGFWWQLQLFSFFSFLSPFPKAGVCSDTTYLMAANV